jgi:NTE family protein
MRIRRSQIILKNSISALFLILLSVNAVSQETQRRPTVGLVLSGGGAHGIAHLGVIMVMEEAGLRPDYITGVSMGSIIGGMYSIGYSGDSLYKILKKLNWQLLLSNKIPQNKIIFLEKNNYNNNIFSLPISTGKLSLPSGLINGQLIENTLGYYLWPAADISDFSKLPIPFMCLGTDIINYKKVELRKGYLPDALRASSAVPSIFTPIKIDTLLLVDGGLIRNFAASEAKEMGADIIIGSYTGFHAYKEDELQTVPGIVKQIAFSRSLEDFKEQKKLADILITPQIKKLSKSGFENVDSLVRKGYEAALPYKEYFKKLADSLNHIARQKPLEKILDKQSYSFDRIEIEGNKIYSDNQILGVLDIDPGVKVYKQTLNDKIELLYGKAWFEKVKYRIVPRNDSLILIIECAERPKGILYGSVHFDNTLGSGVIMRVTEKNFLTRRSTINVNSYIARYFRFEANATQFIDKNQKSGASLNFYADNTLVPMMSMNNERVDVISRNFVPGVAISRSIGLNQLMSVSLNYENTNIIPQSVSDNDVKKLTYNYLTSALSFQVNSLDSKHFPKRGLILNVYAGISRLLSAVVRTDTSRSVTSVINSDNYSSERYYTLYGHLRYYFSPSSRLTFLLGGDALYISGTDSLSAQNNFYFIGGIDPVNKRSVPFIGYHTNEIAVSALASIAAEADIELFKDIQLQLMASVAGINEIGSGDSYSLLTGYGMGLGYMSIIGPLKIGIMYGNESNEEYFNKIKGYITLGFKF